MRWPRHPCRGCCCHATKPHDLGRARPRCPTAHCARRLRSCRSKVHACAARAHGSRGGCAHRRCGPPSVAAAACRDVLRARPPCHAPPRRPPGLLRSCSAPRGRSSHPPPVRAGRPSSQQQRLPHRGTKVEVSPRHERRKAGRVERLRICKELPCTFRAMHEGHA